VSTHIIEPFNRIKSLVGFETSQVKVLYIKTKSVDNKPQYNLEVNMFIMFF